MPDEEEEEETYQDLAINWCEDSGCQVFLTKEDYHNFHQSDTPGSDILEDNTKEPPSNKYILRLKGPFLKQNIIPPPKTKLPLLSRPVLLRTSRDLKCPY